MSTKKYRNIQFGDGETSQVLVRKCEAKRDGTYSVLNRKKVEEDGMPKEVATEMLCRPGVRLTNRERKMYQRARQTVYTSTLEKISAADRLAIRLKSSDWEQLGKWLTRHTNRRALIQVAYQKTVKAAAKLADEKITKENEHMLAAQRAIVQRMLAGLDMRASMHDVVIDALEVEIARRRAFIANLQKIKQEELARKVAAQLLGPL